MQLVCYVLGFMFLVTGRPGLGIFLLCLAYFFFDD